MFDQLLRPGHTVAEVGAETIRRHRPMVTIEAAPDILETILATLSRLDYDCLWYASGQFDPDNFRQARENL